MRSSAATATPAPTRPGANNLSTPESTSRWAASSPAPTRFGRDNRIRWVAGREVWSALVIAPVRGSRGDCPGACRVVRCGRPRGGSARFWPPWPIPHAHRETAVWVLLTGEGDIRVERVSAPDRVLCRVRSRQLDRQLADGACPDANMSLALRARLLMRPTTRSQLARSIARVLAQASEPRRRWPTRGSRVPVAKGNVVEAAPSLEALSDRLRGPVPVSVRGMASVELLLGDGVGPVYNPHCPRQLRDMVDEALRSLAQLDGD